ncbi:MAG TPA: glycosyltransferase, partial [Anaerovoracaceae bacterium]|nr:glycosyltransferase [Anaerovoracaceae bacterium]
RAEDNKSKNEIVLSIIIPCYNNVNFTKSAIQDLLKLPSNHEVILVDNASTDTTGLIIHELMETRNKENAELKYIGCPKNLGFGRANNKGYKRAKGKNILFLNNDIKVKDNFDTWTQTLIDACQAGKLVSANGGMLDNQFNFIRETDNLIDSEYFYLSGWCLAGSRETFDKLTMNHYSDDVTDEIKEGQAWGPWNEKFFAYFEDDDLTWRAKEMGIPLDVIQVPVHHFGRMTTKKLNLASMYKTSQEIFRSLWSKKLVK